MKANNNVFGELCHCRGKIYGSNRTINSKKKLEIVGGIIIKIQFSFSDSPGQDCENDELSQP